MHRSHKGIRHRCDPGYVKKLLQRSPHRKGLDGLVVRLRLRHALVDPLVRDGVVLLLLGALALDALAAHGGVERERRKNQRHGGGEEGRRCLRGSGIEIRGTPRPRPRVRRNRIVPVLVRAGATIDEDRRTALFQTSYADMSDYLKAVLEAGGIRAYERQHRTAFANILNRGKFAGKHLPSDVIPKIVDYCFHVGWFAIERDERDHCEVYLEED